MISIDLSTPEKLDAFCGSLARQAGTGQNCDLPQLAADLDLITPLAAGEDSDHPFPSPAYLFSDDGPIEEPSEFVRERRDFSDWEDEQWIRRLKLQWIS